MRKPRALKPGQLQTTLIGEGYQIDQDDWLMLGLEPWDAFLTIKLENMLRAYVETLMHTRAENGDDVVIFHWRGQAHATDPRETRAEALALALLYVVRKSLVT